MNETIKKGVLYEIRKACSYFGDRKILSSDEVKEHFFLSR